MSSICLIATHLSNDGTERAQKTEGAESDAIKNTRINFVCEPGEFGLEEGEVLVAFWEVNCDVRRDGVPPVTTVRWMNGVGRAVTAARWTRRGRRRG